jgi:hypothetical protein
LQLSQKPSFLRQFKNAKTLTKTPFFSKFVAVSKTIVFENLLFLQIVTGTFCENNVHLPGALRGVPAEGLAKNANGGWSEGEASPYYRYI